MQIASAPALSLDHGPQSSAVSQDPPSQSFIFSLSPPQPPVSASQRQLLLPRELPGLCPLPTYEETWLFTLVEESHSMRV